MNNFKTKSVEYASAALRKLANAALANAEIVRLGITDIPEEVRSSILLDGTCGNFLETEQDLDNALKIVREIRSLRSELRK